MKSATSPPDPNFSFHLFFSLNFAKYTTMRLDCQENEIHMEKILPQIYELGFLRDEGIRF